MNTNVIPLPQASEKPRISVIMVSYETGPALLQSVNSVLKDRDIFELILVDNGNQPGARRRLSELVMTYDKVRILQGHGNVGFAKGCNYGAKMASGEFLLFLNPDALLEPRAARAMVESSRALSRPWAVGGKLLDIHGREQRGGRRRALTPWSAFCTFTGLHKIPGIKPIHMEGDPLPLGPTPVPVVSGAFIMLDRLSFDEIGGFDERYFLHVEDIDLCRRIQEAGGDVIFVPSATVMHYGSTSRVPRLKIEWEKSKGFVIYFVRHSKHWWSKGLALLAAPLMTAAIMSRACYLTIRRALTGR